MKRKLETCATRRLWASGPTNLRVTFAVSSRISALRRTYAALPKGPCAFGKAAGSVSGRRISVKLE